MQSWCAFWWFLKKNSRPTKFCPLPNHHFGAKIIEIKSGCQVTKFSMFQITLIPKIILIYICTYVGGGKSTSLSCLHAMCMVFGVLWACKGASVISQWCCAKINSLLLFCDINSFYGFPSIHIETKKLPNQKNLS